MPTQQLVKIQTYMTAKDDNGMEKFKEADSSPHGTSY